MNKNDNNAPILNGNLNPNSAKFKRTVNTRLQKLYDAIEGVGKLGNRNRYAALTRGQLIHLKASVNAQLLKMYTDLNEGTEAPKPFTLGDDDE